MAPYSYTFVKEKANQKKGSKTTSIAKLFSFHFKNNKNGSLRKETKYVMSTPNSKLGELTLNIYLTTYCSTSVQTYF